MDKQLIVALVQVLLVFLVIIIITFFIRLNNAFKLEKRIARYSVRYNKNSTNVSVFDKFWNQYLSFVKKQRKKIRRLFPSLIKRYDKYSVGTIYKTEDFITHKLVISVLFIILTIISQAIQGRFIL